MTARTLRRSASTAAANLTAAGGVFAASFPAPARGWPVVSGVCHDRMVDETLGGRDAKRCGAAHFVVRRNDGNNKPPALVRRVERVGTRGGTARASVP